MGISSALYTGVSGLNTNGNAMSVIGNNLANTNTVAYKGSRTIFSDLLSSSISGSGGTSQVGRGVGLSTVDNVFSQGTFETTSSGLDLAIEGQSFFLVSAAGEETVSYTRAGAFKFNDDGFLVNPEGLRVQGVLYDNDGKLLVGKPKDIFLDSEGLIQGKATNEMVLNTNLDSNAKILATGTVFDYENTDTFTYSSSTQVFDSLGDPHLLTTYFSKVDANHWQVRYSSESSNPTPLPLPNITAGTPPTTGPNNQDPKDIYFGENGELIDGPAPGGTPLDGPETMTTVALDWDNKSTKAPITLKLDMTQFNSDSVVISQDQNGYGPGSLSGVKVNSDGVIVASYSNGEKKLIAGISLAKFLDPSALEMKGNNLFGATLDSGAPRVGLPNAELGNIFSSSLEMSNVDVAAEMVKMITTQRGYQANSKIITTVDGLLEEVINLKR